jgi:hypothetical protein
MRYFHTGQACCTKGLISPNNTNFSSPVIYSMYLSNTFTYDHRTLKTGLPVRSALLKQRTGGLVVRWVTTSEYPLLYVFGFVFGTA